MSKETWLGILIPFLGTTLGSAFVFLIKEIKPNMQKILLGFASGVMLAASVWSLLIPSIEMAKGISWIPAAVGFLFGMLFLLFLDNTIPHLHVGSDEPEGRASHLKKSAMLILAVTLHNIPEGMAVGVVFAGMRESGSLISFSGAMAMSLGIALQNIPEGAIISMPLKADGVSKGKAFLKGTASGIVEPIGAILVILLTHLMVPILPYLLAFAAGAMVYVVTEELIPEAQEGAHSNLPSISLAIGFTVMMVMDVALG
jgi:ZIP family zinc transporter